MQNSFLVVSYDPDQQQWFYDTVPASFGTDSTEKAAAFICKIRPYVTDADGLAVNEVIRMATRVKNRKDSDSLKRIQDIINESFADQSLFTCQNCRNDWPEELLITPILDLEQRVSPGEIMPAGECPYCGAVCHEKEAPSGTKKP